MPYYRITVWTKRRHKPYKGIRLIEINNPDTVLRLVNKKLLERMNEREILKLEVVMLPKSSDEVKRFLDANYNKNKRP